MESIFLIDDHPLLRRGIVQLLEEEEAGFLVLGEAGSGSEALSTLATFDQEPDLILLDLNMKGMDGLETLRELRKRGCRSRIIALTVSDNREDVLSMLRAGADGYLLKDMEPAQLVAKLQQATTGQLVVDESLAGILASALQSKPASSQPDLTLLTPRELEILQLIAEGLSNKLVARRLNISDGTVKVHVKNLLKKLNLHSRLEAALWMVNQRTQAS